MAELPIAARQMTPDNGTLRTWKKEGGRRRKKWKSEREREVKEEGRIKERTKLKDRVWSTAEGYLTTNGRSLGNKGRKM